MKVGADLKFTPKQVAKAIGVSESSVKRWCDRGDIGFTTTLGGHRRIDLGQLESFCQSHGYEIQQPEIVNLPAHSGATGLGLKRAAALFRENLPDCDEDLLFEIIYDLHRSGHGYATIADMVIAPAFHGIGDSWESGELEIFEERRACTLMDRIANTAINRLPRPARDAPIVVGGSLTDDWYSVANRLIEMSLWDLGFRAIYLGSNLPPEQFQQVVEQYEPAVIWLSIGSARNEGLIQDRLRKVASFCDRKTILAVGGRNYNLKNPVPGTEPFEDIESMANFLKRRFKR